VSTLPDWLASAKSVAPGGSPEEWARVSAAIETLEPHQRHSFIRALSSKLAWDSATPKQRLAAIDVSAGIMPHPNHPLGFNLDCAHCIIHYLRGELRRYYDVEPSA
jgi:tRNA A37 methylthiotransferase MiaB